MSWVAMERYGVREAPAGLALVQELVNTRAIKPYASDLLADRASAEEWLAGACRAWAGVHGFEPPEFTLSESDVRTLRTLRTTFEHMVTGAEGTDAGLPTAPGPQRGVPVRLTADSGGRVQMVPVGSGAAWLESALWSETLLAQRAGIWSRLKVCRNPECRSSFYDTSRNNSGVWHSVRTCGNAANLRASRRRRKADAAAEADGQAQA